MIPGGLFYLKIKSNRTALFTDGTLRKPILPGKFHGGGNQIRITGGTPLLGEARFNNLPRVVDTYAHNHPSGFLRTFYHFGYILDSSASESTPYRSLTSRQSFQVVRIGIAQRISLISFGIGTAFSSTK